jgi:hypothetical protein
MPHEDVAELLGQHPLPLVPDENFHFRFRMIEGRPAASPIVARVPSGRARSTTGMPARSMIA